MNSHAVVVVVVVVVVVAVVSMLHDAEVVQQAHAILVA